MVSNSIRDVLHGFGVRLTKWILHPLLCCVVVTVPFLTLSAQETNIRGPIYEEEPLTAYCELPIEGVYQLYRTGLDMSTFEEVHAPARRVGLDYSSGWFEVLYYEDTDDDQAWDDESLVRYRGMFRHTRSFANNNGVVPLTKEEDIKAIAFYWTSDEWFPDEWSTFRGVPDYFAYIYYTDDTCARFNMIPIRLVD